MEQEWISQTSSGLDKGQCNLQICMRLVGRQPYLVIFFRGKRISDNEKSARPKDVDIFQENAWADTTVSVAWGNKTLKHYVKDHLTNKKCI